MNPSQRPLRNSATPLYQMIITGMQSAPQLSRHLSTICLAAAVINSR
jgi:hypothetical protein